MKTDTKRQWLAVSALSLLLTGIVLSYSTSEYGFAMFVSYFSCPMVLLLNWLPIFLLMTLFWLATGRGRLALILTALPVLALALVNYYKLLLRNDPLLFADLSLVSEAANMTGQYTIVPTVTVVAGLLVLALAIWAARGLRLRGHAMLRVFGALACAAALAVYAFVICPSDFAYQRTRNNGLASEWSGTGNYVCRGVIYPFLRSAKDARDTPPAGYDAQAAEAELASLGDDDIPDAQKVDVVAVMLEAFNDFSKFPGLEWVDDPYAAWHALEAESYHGELVTNIFAGETINTERAFLTGFVDPCENYRTNLCSYVWYFRQQGYRCEGSHPGYNWFYNRLNVNEYLGFERFWFREDRFAALTAPGTLADDNVFLPTILDDYQAHVAQSDAPYFHFSVTYQNHGPYFKDARYASPYLAWNESYNETDYNYANNYLDGIAKTCREVSNLVDSFRDLDRPVVLIFFGDHNPWWGDGNSTYHMFNINLDLGTEEGFYNYYCTPYLIWANDAAKQVLGNAFEGDGGRISPCFLMSRLFHLAQWKGPAYLKALNQLESHAAFLNRRCYCADGTLLAKPATEADTPDWLRDFQRVEYYQKHAPVNP